MAKATKCAHMISDGWLLSEQLKQSSKPKTEVCCAKPAKRSELSFMSVAVVLLWLMSELIIVGWFYWTVIDAHKPKELEADWKVCEMPRKFWGARCCWCTDDNSIVHFYSSMSLIFKFTFLNKWFFYWHVVTFISSSVFKVEIHP